MHLRQLGFTYSKCKAFTKTKKKQKNLKRFKSEINKNCFPHDMNDMAYGDCKVLPKGKVADEKIM